MRKIKTITYLFFVILLLSGCETTQSVRLNLEENLLSPETRLMTDNGPVIGFIDQLGVKKWLGIPFAEPPISELRWRAPIKINNWKTLKEVNSFSPPCTQFQSSLTADGLVKPGDIIGSEDCLYLNVYAPNSSKNKLENNNELLPVMVWIHGGGNTTGMPSEYNPEIFVKTENIIFVSMSYRLGFFGWLSHPLIREQSGLNASSNFGLLDQILAVQWVKDNIQFFGGNPNNITIFGESAGGQDVIALYTSPIAKGLFERAISQSGGTSVTSIADAEKINRYDSTLKNNYKYRHLTTEEWIDVLYKKGLINSKFDDEEVLSDLRSLSSHDLMNAIAKGEFWDEQRDLARIIGDDIVVPKEGILGSLSDSNKHANVPIIFGINKDENKLFNFFDEKYVSNFFNIYFRVRDAFYYDLISDYQSLAWRSNGLDTPADLVKNSGQENVYAYRFDWDEQPSILGMDFSFLLGAGHGLEIPFVMGDFDFGRQTRFLFTKKNESERIKLSKLIMQYWAHFAKAGYPNAQLENAVQWGKWPKGGINKDRIMILDTEQSNAPRMSNGYAPHDKLVNIFENDERSLKVNNKCSFLEDVYSWVDNWQIKNDACR